MKSLIIDKIVIAGDPDLIDIELKPDGDAHYTFSLINIRLDDDQRWKRLSMKAPERKNYKDLDRQVEFIIKEETERKIISLIQA